MASVKLYNMKGDEIGTIDLNDEIFSAPVSEHLLHKVVVAQLANRRQGTQKAKTRSEVRGGGRKPWRQKGTGHARQGSIRAPQWKGGGVVFAPVPRDYSQKVNKREKRAALMGALTSKVQDESLIVLDQLSLDEIKTKSMKSVLDAFDADKTLIITSIQEYADGEGAEEKERFEKEYTNVYDSMRNIPDTKMLHIKKLVRKMEDGEEEVSVSSTLNVYDILNSKKIIATKAAIEMIEEVYA